MRCAVLGDPIGHSLSPALHRAAYAALGLDWEYDAVRVPTGTLASFLAGLDDSWRGLSLTMPLKREVLPLLTDRDSWVQLSRVANTLVLDETGRHGHNTDIPGAIAAIRSRTTRPLDRAVVLGGGATATSVLYALAELGCRDAAILVREPARATETVAAVARYPAAPRLRVGRLDETVPADTDIVVSTIPAAAQTPVLVSQALAAPVVFEVLYSPWPTPLASAVGAAGDAGRELVSGLDLLVEQAVLQVRLMTEVEAVPVDGMRAAGEAALRGSAQGDGH